MKNQGIFLKLFLITVCISCSIISVTFGQFPAEVRFDSLSGPNSLGFIIAGINQSNFPVIENGSYIGDINADGIDDFALADPEGNSLDGICYVIWGRNTAFPDTLNLDQFSSSDGFIIQGANNSSVGSTISAAGDINADGVDDFLLHSFRHLTFGTSSLIYGRNTIFPDTLHIDSISGDYGVMIIETVPSVNDDYGAKPVDGIGDFNGDGIDDFIISEHTREVQGTGRTGTVSIIYGNASLPATIDLSTGLSPSLGHQLNGISLGGWFGYQVAGIGDFNGDNLDDIQISAPNASQSGSPYRSGVMYIIFGDSSIETSLTSIDSLNGSNGFIVKGAVQNASLGRRIGKIGDVNIDGLSDLYLPQASSDTGYVIWGTSAFLPAEDSIIGYGEAFGIPIKIPSHSSAIAGGDINGDSIQDFAIQAGSVFNVIYGSQTSYSDSIYSTLTDGINGFSYIGSLFGDFLGDINGDGIDDLFFGGNGGAGVIFGRKGMNTSIEAQSIERVIDLFIWPNPTPDIISISSDQFLHTDLEIQLLDSRGRIHPITPFSVSSDVSSIDMSPFPSGIYFLKVIIKDHQRTLKFVKQ